MKEDPTSRLEASHIVVTLAGLVKALDFGLAKAGEDRPPQVISASI